MNELVTTGKKNIDLLFGGHTHTFMDVPEVYKNKTGSDVLIKQVGWAGIQLGRLDFDFAGFRRNKLAKLHTVVVREKTNE